MNLISKKSVSIRSNLMSVWDTLTNPDKIKQWLYGTTTITDWTIGSPIVFQGEWEGKMYEDKGTILTYIPEHQIRYTYWSSMSGLEDKPENYAHVTYDLAEDGDQILLTVTQDNISSEESRKHSEDNWATALGIIKDLTEERVE